MHYNWVVDPKGSTTAVWTTIPIQCAGRLTGWRQKVWSRRYQAIVISQEEEAQVDRLTYVLSNGVKEGLVEKVLDWPAHHGWHFFWTGRFSRW